MEEVKSENKKQDDSKVITISIIIIIISIIGFFIIEQRPRVLPPRMVCGTNINGLGKALLVYTNDFNGYPTPEIWCDLLIEYCEVTPKSFRCKGAKEGPCNYAINKYLAEITTAKDPDMVVLFETYPGWNQVGGPEILTIENHKGEGCNVVFLDTHTEFIKAEDISKLKWKPEE